MKKIHLLAALILLSFTACQKTDKPVAEEETLSIKNRSCAAEDVLKSQLAADPALRLRMQEIEAFTSKVITNGETFRNAAGEMIVPVVVHVLYNRAQENISDAQVSSQIEVLNEDFNLLNKDISKVPQIFSASTGNTGIRFLLVQTIRKQTPVTTWLANDDMKNNAKGGSDVVDPGHKLNIWVCNLGDGLLGYAQFPGGNPATDGVVVGYFCFGRTGKLEKRFDKGRTTTHEVGHWMNLRHIWGDVYCGNDLVGDTPQATIYNFGCPSFPKYNNCRSKEIEMTMNYMDYTDDACMFMFTNGQSDRMKAIFLNGGPRGNFF
jgi:hypothetical protein